MSELKLRPSKNILLEILGGLGEVGGAAEIAPIMVPARKARMFSAWAERHRSVMMMQKSIPR
jgi:hypothetical protein